MKTVLVEAIYRSAGRNVRFYRLRRGWHQGEFAERLGIARTSIVNFEAGKQRCMLHDLETMARLLRMPLKTLLFAREALRGKP